MNEGLIGNWSPGLGDPSIGGWLTVLLYVVAALASWRVLALKPDRTGAPQGSERGYWMMLFVALVFLGINKQLDLQSALTEMGRMLAMQQGWYEDRQQVQMAFVVGALMAGLTVLAALINLTWGSPRATQLSLVGIVFLGVFVLGRAASFHRVDLLLATDVAGLRVNWLFEMGALAWIIACARTRSRSRRTTRR